MLELEKVLNISMTDALNRAIKAHHAGDTITAQEIYTEFLHNSRNPDANYNLGVLLMNKGENKKSLSFLEVALKANPNVRQFWLTYLNALIRLERITEARQVYKQAESRGITCDPFSKVRSALGLKNRNNRINGEGEFDEKTLTTKEVARRAGVHKDTLLRWLRNGLIPEPQRDYRKWRRFSVIEATEIVRFSKMKISRHALPFET